MVVLQKVIASAYLVQLVIWEEACSVPSLLDAAAREIGLKH